MLPVGRSARLGRGMTRNTRAGGSSAGGSSAGGSSAGDSRARGLLDRVLIKTANIRQKACLTHGFSGFALVASVQNEPVVGIEAISLRHNVKQIGFYSLWFFGVRESQAPAHAADVCVHGDRRLVESDVQNDIRRFSADAGKLYECLELVGNVALVVLDEPLRGRKQMPDLGPIIIERTQIGLELALGPGPPSVVASWRLRTRPGWLDSHPGRWPGPTRARQPEAYRASHTRAHWPGPAGEPRKAQKGGAGRPKRDAPPEPGADQGPVVQK